MYAVYVDPCAHCLRHVCVYWRWVLAYTALIVNPIYTDVTVFRISEKATHTAVCLSIMSIKKNNSKHQLSCHTDHVRSVAVWPHLMCHAGDTAYIKLAQDHTSLPTYRECINSDIFTATVWSYRVIVQFRPFAEIAISELGQFCIDRPCTEGECRLTRSHVYVENKSPLLPVYVHAWVGLYVIDL